MDGIPDATTGRKYGPPRGQLELEAECTGDPFDDVQAGIRFPTLDLRDVSRGQAVATSQFLSVDVER